jgi:hypothetical protein
MNSHNDLTMQQIQTTKALTRWLNVVLGLRVPAAGICPGHQGPLAYLRSAYFEPTKDVIVWAPRGGGKTRLGAAATLLDLLHKPGCEIRILGGSLEQSLKMWDHLYPDVLRLAEPLLRGQSKSKRIDLKNGSTAAVLTQSQRAVRGLRVQKLRCDEVELFDDQVWEAAQLVTKSKLQTTPGQPIAGVVEAFSTLHRPYGLMNRIVEEAERTGTRVIKWCLMEVLEKCPPERDCASCPLWEDCHGVAKEKCDGFVRIDDAIAMKRRVSQETWEAEMMCRRPSLRDAVFARFDPAIHVREEVASCQLSVVGISELWLAMDFGFSNPFVCLWIRSFTDGVVHVIDEYVQPQRMMHEHVEEIAARKHGTPAKVACDPAGAGRNEHTGMSNVQVLRRAGYAVRFKGSRILEGVELIRTALRPAAGEPKLFIHPRCQRLIKAMRSYRYAEGGSELPLKDGHHDHLIDALRYYYVNSNAPAAEGRSY